MSSNADNIALKILYFGSHSKVLDQLKKTFPDRSVLQVNSLEDAFKVIATNPLSGLVFETYQSDPYFGINPTDLDVLLYFASSEESARKDVPVLPIDPPYSNQDKKSQNYANNLYEDVYGKYLSLLPATEFDNINRNSFDFSEGIELLNSLVETLDDATEQLDNKLNKTSWSEEEENTVISKTTLNLQEESHRVSGSEEQEKNLAFTVAGEEDLNEASQRVGGSKEDLTEASQRVEGSKEDLTETSQRVGGSKEDLTETSQRIDGSKEDLTETSQRIEGSKEDLTETSQRVGGSKEDLTETSQRVGGSKEDLTETSQRIEGSKEDLTEASQRIGGSKEDLTEAAQIISGSKDNLNEKSQKISGSKEEFTEETQVISGNKEMNKEEKFIISSDENVDQSPGFNKVKSSTEHIADGFYELKTSQEETSKHSEEDSSVQDINHRNKQGQTPIMVFASKGESEKVIALIKAGADTDLICKDGKTVLHYACRRPENIDLIKDLVETFDCKVSKRDSNGLDPLFDAIGGDNDLAIEYLVSQGARLTSKYEGRTYLHLAAEANNFKAFKALLTSGANPELRDHRGKSVYDFVRSKKNLPFLKLLEVFKRLKAKQAA